MVEGLPSVAAAAAVVVVVVVVVVMVMVVIFLTDSHPRGLARNPTVLLELYIGASSAERLFAFIVFQRKFYTTTTISNLD